MNPIFEKDGEWFFWDETWVYDYGPYFSEYSVHLMLVKYCEIVLG